MRSEETWPEAQHLGAPDIRSDGVQFDELLQIARNRDDVVGLFLFGSRGRNFMVDERSDWDVAVVMSDHDAVKAFKEEFPYVHGALVEVVACTLDDLQDVKSEHARYAAAHAQLLIDKTGGNLTRVVVEQELLPAGSRDGVIREALDDYINQTYRSLRYGTRLDAVEAVPYALRVIFALEGRVRPYNKYLAWELEHHPLDRWPADALLPLLDGVLTGEPAAQHKLFRMVEGQARADGFGDVIDTWEPDVEWLRGHGGYREGRLAPISPADVG